MSYDEKHYNPEPNSARIAFKLIAVVLALVLVFYGCFCLGKAQGKREAFTSLEQIEEKNYHRHDSLTITYTYDGEEIRYYVMVDPDKNIQYLVNDRGGMCVREGV